MWSPKTAKAVAHLFWMDVMRLSKRLSAALFHAQRSTIFMSWKVTGLVLQQCFVNVCSKHAEIRTGIRRVRCTLTVSRKFSTKLVAWGLALYWIKRNYRLLQRKLKRNMVSGSGLKTFKAAKVTFRMIMFVYANSSPYHRATLSATWFFSKEYSSFWKIIISEITSFFWFLTSWTLICM